MIQSLKFLFHIFWLGILLALPVRAEWVPVQVGTIKPFSDNIGNVHLVLSSDNIPFIAVRTYGKWPSSQGQAITVMKFDGTQWVNVGNLILADNDSRPLILGELALSSDNIPFVAFLEKESSERYQVKVAKFDGTQWIQLGEIEHFTDGPWVGGVAGIRLALSSDDIPVVAFRDDFHNYAHVLKFDGTQWVHVGDPSFSAGRVHCYIPLTGSLNKTLFVGFNAAPLNFAITVMKFNGTQWNYVGEPGFYDNNNAGRLKKLALSSDNTLFVDFYTRDHKSLIMKFDGMQWVNVGEPIMGFSRLALSSQGIPFIAFRDVDRNIMVSKWDGTQWSSIGKLTASGGGAIDFALSSDDTPFVAYWEWNNYQDQLNLVKFIDDSTFNGQPIIEVLPIAQDFGTIRAGDGPSEPQLLTVKNTGKGILHIEEILLTGANATEFSFQKWDCAYGVFPSEQCTIYVTFSPQITTAAGDKQATLTMTSNAEATIDVTLTGTVRDPFNCTQATLTSATDGAWDSPTTWLQARIPAANDIAQINQGHTITGIEFAKVGALCIEKGGILTSLDKQGTALEIQATDYIENNGKIVGKNGAHEAPIGNCTQPKAVGETHCAQPGASVILKVGTQIENHAKNGDWWWHSYSSGGPIVNTGQIIAGQGGNGSQYAAPGGHALVLGRNTGNQGIIKAGAGGNLTGQQIGQAGKGGVTQIWGKLGGSGALYNQNGAQAIAGDGGNCNPNATSPQTGGQGGNLWLVSLPEVYLNGGEHRAGKAGNHCSSSTVGDVIIEPSLIDLSNANTVVEGGHITIFGGNDMVLDLSHLNQPVLNATGDITLAVGENGIIDLTGNTTPIFQAGGQLKILSDNVLLDDNTTLADIAQVDGDIITADSQNSYDVAVTAPHKVTGKLGDTLSVRLTIANNGPDTDTYQLKITPVTNWLQTQLPPTLTIAGLEVVEFSLDALLPQTCATTDAILTVTATSQTDASVQASAEIHLSIDDPVCQTVAYHCCSYVNAAGQLICDASLGSYSFAECKTLAKQAGAKQFKWGQVAENTAQQCWADGDCGTQVHEYLKMTLIDFTATATKQGIRLKWSAALDDTLAFRLHRGIPKGKTCTKQITDYTQVVTLKDPQESSRDLLFWTLGNSRTVESYTYLDEDVISGMNYCYVIEDIGTYSGSTYYLDEIVSANAR